MRKDILGFDPTKFKYEKNDGKTTTLRHKDGHSVTIAHSAISPKMQVMLKALKPVDKDNEEMAKGGRVSDQEIRKQRETAKDADPKPAGTNEHFSQKGGQTPIGQMQRENNLREFKKSPGPNIKGMAEGGIAGGHNYAYDHHLPCLNPSCKSHGKPHPNCRCYGMAEGGEISNQPYCASKKPHKKGCQYFQEGGSVKSDDHTFAGDDYGPPPDYDPQAPATQNVYTYPNGRNKIQPDPASPEPARMPDAPEEDMSGYTEFRRQGMADGGDVGQVDAQGNVSGAQHGPSGPIQQAFDVLVDHLQRGGMQGKLKEQAQANPQPTQSVPAMSQPQTSTATADTPPSIYPDQSQGAAQPDAQAAQDSPQQPGQDTPSPPQDAMDKALPPQGMPGSPVPAPAMAPPMTPQQQSQQASMADYTQSEQNTINDLAKGHITPKTFGSLWHDASTPRKLSMVLGLIIGGFDPGGKGNGAVQALNNIIHNDLQAQTTSASNAQNLLRIHQQTEMNKANVGALNAETALRAQTKAQADATWFGFDHLARGIRAMPEGSPQRLQGEQTLTAMMPMISAANTTAYAKAAAAEAAMKSGNMAGTPVDDEQAFQQQQRGLRMSGSPFLVKQADLNEARHIPGVPGAASMDIPQEKRNKVQAMSVFDNKMGDLINYAQQHRGSINPAVLQTANQKAQEATAFYNQSIDSLGMTPGRLGWLEEQIKTNPTSVIQQVLGNNQRLGEIKNSNKKRMDMELNALGFKSSGSQSQPPPQSNEIERYDPTSGKTVVFDAKTKKPLRWK